MSTTVYVVTNTNHPDVEPFVFADRGDAKDFAAARWPTSDGVHIQPQALVDHELAMEMIRDEQDVVP